MLVNGSLAKVTYFILRVVVGFLFMQHGGMNIFDWFGGVPGGHPEPWTQVWIGGVLEFWGGLLVLLGLATRWVAFVLSGEMAVAYWQFHFKPEQFWPVQNNGVPAVLYCFIFLYIAAYGGGPWSLDAWLRARRAGAEATHAQT